MNVPEFRGWMTVVGTRDTTDEEWDLLADTTSIQTNRGFGMRSGGAGGSDEAGYQGALRVLQRLQIPPIERIQVFLPWNGMKRDYRDQPLPKLYHDPSKGIYDASQFENWAEAERIALEARGTWDGLGQGGIKLHCRNSYQPLGPDLQTWSKALLCCATPVGKKGTVKGGTNTAVQIALTYNIRVLNIRRDEDLRVIEKLHAEYPDLKR